MKSWFFLMSFLVSAVQADTIGNYMSIAKGIPQMEMKADPKAQAWARSARNIVTITDESIGQSLEAINALASKQGRPFFCLKKTTLSATLLDGVIRQTYEELAHKKQNIDKMTISEIALIGLIKKYPCASSARDKQMQHIAKLLK